MKTHTLHRRTFLGQTAAAAGSLLLSARGSRGATLETGRDEHDEGVGPTEDLMREHGVLKRILLIYRDTIRRGAAREDYPHDVVRDGARIIQRFIEQYHEKLEEDYLFPRFEKAGTLTDLTAVLRAQHQAGRQLTARIVAARTPPYPDMRQFVRMYEPHEAREDTVLFPALHRIVSSHEFGALGEEFEKKERQLFGEDGFEHMVDQVAGLERRLGIYDLAQFTPRV